MTFSLLISFDAYILIVIMKYTEEDDDYMRCLSYIKHGAAISGLYFPKTYIFPCNYLCFIDDYISFSLYL